MPRDFLNEYRFCSTVFSTINADSASFGYLLFPRYLFQVKFVNHLCKIFLFNISTPSISIERIQNWCTTSNVDFTPEFATMVKAKVNELYMNDDFRQNVFAAMREKWDRENTLYL